MPDAGNLFASLPEAARSEAVDALLERDGVTVERIVSRGQTSPADSGGGDSGGGDFGGGDSGGGDSGGGWYDQDRHEWVGVLRGAARLMFEGGREVQLGPGDWVDLPAHTKHRVSWTDPDQDTVWLAVFWDAK